MMGNTIMSSLHPPIRDTYQALVWKAGPLESNGPLESRAVVRKTLSDILGKIEFFVRRFWSEGIQGRGRKEVVRFLW